MLIPKSLGLLIAFGLGCEVALASEQSVLGYSLSTGDQTAVDSLKSKFVERCCQIGRERATESQKFNCKLGAREALLGQNSDRVEHKNLLAESLLRGEPNFADQCELVLESCCLAVHRTRNCDSGKQFAKSGASCLDVELSKEATVATESFNDCCMSCSLGTLAARNSAHNESSGQLQLVGHAKVASRCKLTNPLAASLSGQLYEQTYLECCEENLPRVSSTLIEPGAQIDCAQANPCSQRCLTAGSFDRITGRLIESDRCECFSGFKLAQDQTNCVDVDECKLNLHTCNKQSQICDNIRGSFRCLARATQRQAIGSPVAPRAFLQSSTASFAHEDADALEQPNADQPFSSLRLCALGSRWSQAENRCQPIEIGSSGENLAAVGQRHQQRSASLVAFSSLARRASSRD